MSRSAKSAPQPPTEGTAASGTPSKAGGKGRPTPTRKEAEAAARARAKTPRSRKEIAMANRKARESASAKIREAYKTGDETHLPGRDRGPVRRFIRDYIDVRFSFIELLLPIMLVVLLLGFVPSESIRATSEIMLLGVMLFIVLEMVFLRMKLRKELAVRFPDSDLKGTTYYAVSRAMQMKFMRLPKPQRKIGDTLPENYR